MIAAANQSKRTQIISEKPLVAILDFESFSFLIVVLTVLCIIAIKSLYEVLATRYCTTDYFTLSLQLTDSDNHSPVHALSSVFLCRTDLTTTQLVIGFLG